MTIVQNMLERHINPDRINVKRLTLETPQPREELPFDPERDLTEEDWKMLRVRTVTFKETLSVKHPEEVALKILNPTAPLEVDSKILKQLQQDGDKYLNIGDWWSYSNLASNIKLISGKDHFPINKESWEAMREMIDFLQTQDLTDLAALARNMKILNPDIDFRFKEKQH